MSFNPKKEVENIKKFIRKYYKENNLKGVVIGISGGKDSAVVSGLFSLALGCENVIGVSMPCFSKDEDIVDAKVIADYFGFELINVDLTQTFNSLKNEMLKLDSYSNNELKDSDINLKPRLRMCTLYYIAALYSRIKNGTYIVAGTSNKSELYIGYFTKGGDSSYDIGILNEYTVEEVIEIGKYINVPNEILFKVPHDGLCDMTDEEKTGIKYSDISLYLKNKNNVSNKIKSKIEKLHFINKHKFNNVFYKRDL